MAGGSSEIGSSIGNAALLSKGVTVETATTTRTECRSNMAAVAAPSGCSRVHSVPRAGAGAGVARPAPTWRVASGLPRRPAQPVHCARLTADRSN